MWLDEDVFYPWVLVAMVNLALLGAMIAAVWRTIVEYRVMRNVYRARLARWLREPQES